MLQNLPEVSELNRIKSPPRIGFWMILGVIRSFGHPILNALLHTKPPVGARTAAFDLLGKFPPATGERWEIQVLTWVNSDGVAPIVQGVYTHHGKHPNRNWVNYNIRL